MMKRTRCLTVAAVFAAALAVSGPVMAHDDLGTHMSGVQEVPPVFSDGHGFAFVTINDDQSAIVYSMVYFDLGSDVTQSHIHFGTPGVNGGIVAFLCSNLLGKPPTIPDCPNGPGFHSVNGVLTADDVGAGAAAQGIGAGNFTGLVEALESSSAYVNVHTANHPSGEIRGQLGH
jgi:hypothetical protein